MLKKLSILLVAGILQLSVVKAYSNKCQNPIDSTSTTPLNDSILLSYLKQLGVQYPLIVLAQSKLESNTYRSKLAKKNHNIFGMRYTKVSGSPAIGKRFSYAVYLCWEDSAKDYLRYQSRFISKISSEKDYYKHIGKNYSHDPHYVASVKKIVKSLEQKFS